MPKVRSALRNRLELLAYSLATFKASLLGRRGRALLGGAIGRLYLRFGRRRREIIDFNLSLVYPQWSASERQAFAGRVAAHFGTAILDTLALRRLGPESLIQSIEIEGREELMAAVDRGRGLFLLSAHIGSWEVAALVAGLLVPAGFAIVNRPLDNSLLEAKLDEIRATHGNRALGKKKVTRGILRQLKEGGAVGILIDQRAQPKEGVPLRFFGHEVMTHVALGKLALKTGAPIVPIWGLRKADGRYLVRFGAEIDATGLEGEAGQLELTRRCLDEIEATIRDYPEQWLWFHDRWRELREDGEVASG